MEIEVVFRILRVKHVVLVNLRVQLLVLLILGEALNRYLDVREHIVEIIVEPIVDDLRRHDAHIDLLLHLGNLKVERLLASQTLGLQEEAALPILAESRIVDQHVEVGGLNVDSHHMAAVVPRHDRVVIARIDALARRVGS